MHHMLPPPRSTWGYTYSSPDTPTIPRFSCSKPGGTGEISPTSFEISQLGEANRLNRDAGLNTNSQGPVRLFGHFRMRHFFIIFFFFCL
ncbi:uncharacterized protein PgNI_08360, partial [Pyricularia grisea]|uniref:Uncharacterized protein n=1 Tax=Pyricularia grisea TaxID=148305 RepID=A0A6P8AVF3_PYRGI